MNDALQESLELHALVQDRCDFEVASTVVNEYEIVRFYAFGKADDKLWKAVVVIGFQELFQVVDKSVLADSIVHRLDGLIAECQKKHHLVMESKRET